MFAKLAEPRAIEPRRAMLGALRLMHSGDNQHTVGPTTAKQTASAPGPGVSVGIRDWVTAGWSAAGTSSPTMTALARGNVLPLSRLPALLGVCPLGKHLARPAVERRAWKVEDGRRT
jgi:hypothetical protein